jgi:creatinine amidohydrolase
MHDIRPLGRLAEMTWQEAEAAYRIRPVGLVPIGATEAHGPHLPLDTDSIIAEATAQCASERLAEMGIPSLIVPGVDYSVTFAGKSFAGTSPVDPDPFEQHLTSVLVHFGRVGLRGLVLCNAHLEPAHVERVQSSARAAQLAAGIPVVAPDQRSERFALLLSEEFRAGARHAGAYETSILLASRPEVVRIEIARRLDPVWIDLPAQLRAGARTFAEAGATLGYFGDPASASAEEGQRMLAGLAEMVMIACQDAGLINRPLASAKA